MSVANGTYQIGASNLDRTTSVRKAADSYDRTTSVRKAPAASNQKSAPAVNTFGSQPKKKSKMPAVIAAVLAVVLLVGAGIFVVPKLIDDNETVESGETSDNVSSENSGTSSETADYSKFDEEQIASIISEAESLASEEDYEGALVKVQTGLITYPKSAELQDKADEYTEALNAQVKTDAIITANSLAGTGDYLSAIQTIEEAIAVIGEDAELTDKAKTYEDAYVSNVVTQIDAYLEEGDFDAAEVLVNEARIHFPNNEVLRTEAETIENSRPKLLMTVCPPYETNYGYYSANKDVVDGSNIFQMTGEAYTNGFKLDINRSNSTQAIFNLKGQYSVLEFDLGHVDGTGGDTLNLKIIKDGTADELIVVSYDDMVNHYEIDVSGVQQLIIEGTGTTATMWGSHYGLANITVR